MFFTKNETFGVASANCLNAIYRQLALFERSGESSELFDFVYTPTHPHTHTILPYIKHH
jgi:hypothetical protein